MSGPRRGPDVFEPGCALGRPSARDEGAVHGVPVVAAWKAKGGWANRGHSGTSDVFVCIKDEGQAAHCLFCFCTWVAFETLFIGSRDRKKLPPDLSAGFAYTLSPGSSRMHATVPRSVKEETSLRPLTNANVPTCLSKAVASVIVRDRL